MKTGEYIDNKLIRLIHLHQKNRGQISLETDQVIIQERATSFAEREFYEGKVRLFLPSYFCEMPKEITRNRYLSSDRPDIIMTSSSYAENIAFNLLEIPLLDPDWTLAAMREAVLRQAPETVMYDTGVLEGKEVTGRWFEYKSFTLDEEAYNLQFLISKEDKSMTGVFNCRMRFYDEWKPYILKILEQIKIT